jgi:hypothetical protein
LCRKCIFLYFKLITNLIRHSLDIFTDKFSKFICTDLIPYTTNMLIFRRIISVEVNYLNKIFVAVKNYYNYKIQNCLTIFLNYGHGLTHRRVHCYYDHVCSLHNGTGGSRSIDLHTVDCGIKTRGPNAIWLTVWRILRSVDNLTGSIEFLLFVKLEYIFLSK